MSDRLARDNGPPAGAGTGARRVAAEKAAPHPEGDPVASAVENWPLPPFFATDSDARASPPVDALIFLRSSDTVACSLLRFQPEDGLVRIRASGEATSKTLDLGFVNSIQLLQQVRMRPDTKLIDLYVRCGGQPIAPSELPFAVEFVNGEHLRGLTKGFVKTKSGLFVFLSVGGDRTIRIFIPAAAIGKASKGPLLGEHLVAKGVVDVGHVELALQLQGAIRAAPADAHLPAPPLTSSKELAARIGEFADFAPVHVTDVIMNRGLVSRDQLYAALRRQQLDGKSRLGDILVDMGVLTRESIAEAVAEQLHLPHVALRDFAVDPAALKLVPAAFAVAHQVLPLLATERVLAVAVESPVDADYLDELRFASQLHVVPVIADPVELAQRIAAEYGAEAEMPDASIRGEIEALVVRLNADRSAVKTSEDELTVATEDEPLLVRLVNNMIVDAYKRGASDIHIESYPDEQPTRVRFRIDGVLSDYFAVPYTLRSALISRIKIMASIDIAEHRHPQDGKIDFSRFAPIKLELRVACLPTTNGLEDIVMRLLAASKPVPLEKLGIESGLAEQLKAMVHRSYGLFLVCGPTGSGKTTTLHSLLAEINTTENKIWTAEDPIEITQPGLRQIQMVPRAGLTFATAMRAFLRADPDVIMVGEMRDAETAHIAIEASLTGHLVMSTLHTNGAPESVVRLLDIGLDPFNFADALIGVLSQRLARRLCAECKVPRDGDIDELRLIAAAYVEGTTLDAQTVLAGWTARYGKDGTELPVVFRAGGCEACNHTGYKGRIGVYELMAGTPAIKKLIQTRAPLVALFECAIAEGMLRLRQYGLIKVMEGLTDRQSIANACA